MTPPPQPERAARRPFPAPAAYTRQTRGGSRGASAWLPPSSRVLAWAPRKCIFTVILWTRRDTRGQSDLLCKQEVAGSIPAGSTRRSTCKLARFQLASRNERGKGLSLRGHGGGISSPLGRPAGRSTPCLVILAAGSLGWPWCPIDLKPPMRRSPRRSRGCLVAASSEPPITCCLLSTSTSTAASMPRLWAWSSG